MVEARRAPANEWVSEVQRLLATSDFVVLDITGFNSNLEIETSLAISSLPLGRLALICCAGPGVRADRTVSVEGIEVFMYKPSLWGTGRVSEYLLRRFNQSLLEDEGRAGPSVHCSHEVTTRLRELGKSGYRAAVRIPVEIHAVTFVAGCVAIVMVLAGVQIPRVGYKAVLGGLALGGTLAWQYLSYFGQWLEASSDRGELA
jgi:hypothetical protein